MFETLGLVAFGVVALAVLLVVLVAIPGREHGDCYTGSNPVGRGERLLPQGGSGTAKPLDTGIGLRTINEIRAEREQGPPGPGDRLVNQE